MATYMTSQIPRPTLAGKFTGTFAQAIPSLHRGQIAAALMLSALALLGGCQPDAPDAAEEIRLGHAALKAGHGTTAVAHFERSLKLQPDLGAFVALSQLYVANGKLEKAHSALERGLKQYADDPALLAMQAEVLASQGHIRDAEKLYRKAHEFKPEQADIMLRWASLVRDPATAITAARRVQNAIKKQPGAETYLVLAELLRIGGDRKRTSEAHRQATRAQSRNPELASALARLYLLHQPPSFDTAERLLRLAVAGPKSNADLSMLHANLAADLGRFSEAEKSLARHPSTEATAPNRTFLKARIALAQKRPAEARDQMLAVMEQVPKDRLGLARSCLGRAHIALGEVDLGLPILEQIKADESGFAHAQLALAKLELASKTPQAAAPRLTRLVQQFPRFEPAYGLLAQLRLDADDQDGAEKILKRGVAQLPSSALLWYELGRLSLAHSPAQAAGRLELAVELAPTLVSSRPLLANALLHTGRPKRATQVYEEGLKLAPDTLAWQNNLAVLYADQSRNLDRALELAKQAYKNGKASAALSDTLGWVHHRRGEHELAAPLLATAAGAMPTDAEVLVHQALNQKALGDRRGAKKLLRRAQLAAEGHPAAESKLKSLLE